MKINVTPAKGRAPKPKRVVPDEIARALAYCGLDDTHRLPMEMMLDDLIKSCLTLEDVLPIGWRPLDSVTTSAWYGLADDSPYLIDKYAVPSYEMFYYTYAEVRRFAKEVAEAEDAIRVMPVGAARTEAEAELYDMTPHADYQTPECCMGSRLKLLKTPATAKGARAIKYLQRSSTGALTYFPCMWVPQFDDIDGDNPNYGEPTHFTHSFSLIVDKRQPLTIVEGGKKAMTAAKYGLNCIGIDGVDNAVKSGNATGLADTFEAIGVRGRNLTIMFDSDIEFETHHAVATASTRLSLALIRNGAASVGHRHVPARENEVGGMWSRPTKSGIDDWILGATNANRDGAPELVDGFTRLMEISRIDTPIYAVLMELKSRFYIVASTNKAGDGSIAAYDDPYTLHKPYTDKHFREAVLIDIHNGTRKYTAAQMAGIGAEYYDDLKIASPETVNPTETTAEQNKKLAFKVDALSLFKVDRSVPKVKGTEFRPDIDQKVFTNAKGWPTLNSYTPDVSVDWEVVKDTPEGHEALDQCDSFFHIAAEMFRAEEADTRIFLMHDILYRLQSLGKKTSRAITFYSPDQRIGKSTFAQSIANMFGPGMVDTAYSHKLGKMFNAEFIGLLIAVLDEGSCRTQEEKDAFKVIVTGLTMLVTQKHVNTMKIDNVLSLMFTTNETDIFFYERGHQRRQLSLMCKRVRGEKLDVVEMFDDIEALALSPVGRACFLVELSRRFPLPEDYNPTDPAPITVASKIFEDATIPQLERFARSLTLDPFTVVMRANNFKVNTPTPGKGGAVAKSKAGAKTLLSDLVSESDMFETYSKCNVRQYGDTSGKLINAFAHLGGHVVVDCTGTRLYALQDRDAPLNYVKLKYPLTALGANPTDGKRARYNDQLNFISVAYAGMKDVFKKPSKGELE